MADTCTTDPKDLAGDRWASLLLWGLPQIAFILGIFVSPPFRTVLWTASLTVIGVACLVNASRCGRLHCYLTGPFSLLGGAASLAYGLGVLPLGPQGWLWIGVTVLVGGIVLRYIPERIWGKYVIKA